MEDLGAKELMAKSTPIVCEQCGCNRFIQVTLLRKVSRLLIGSPEDAVIPVPTFACQDCGNINKEFLPIGISEDDKQEKPQPKPNSNLILP